MLHYILKKGINIIKNGLIEDIRSSKTKKGNKPALWTKHHTSDWAVPYPCMHQYIFAMVY